MTVKKFLNIYNIGRSAIKRAVIVDANESNHTYVYSESELKAGDYGYFGSKKINSFTITEDEIVIYAR